jgi:hypothetical protein
MSKSSIEQHDELRERLCPAQTDLNSHAESPKAHRQMIKIRHDAYNYKKELRELEDNFF